MRLEVVAPKNSSQKSVPGNIFYVFLYVHVCVCVEGARVRDKVRDVQVSEQNLKNQLFSDFTIVYMPRAYLRSNVLSRKKSKVRGDGLPRAYVRVYIYICFYLGHTYGPRF